MLNNEVHINISILLSLMFVHFVLFSTIFCNLRHAIKLSANVDIIILFYYDVYYLYTCNFLNFN